MAKQRARKRFAVGAKVRILTPGITGAVTQADDELTVLGEYWHRIETEHGERREPGSNLELIPTAIGGEPVSPDTAIRSQLVGYFRDLEMALDEHIRRGTPNGDPIYQKIYEELTDDIAKIGIGQDQIEALAAQCGHGTTFARLEKLRKKPLGFSR